MAYYSEIELKEIRFPWKTYVGIPAKEVGEHSKELLELEKNI